MSQSLIVPSSDADASSLPSGENATALTAKRCPLSSWTCSPVAEAQSLTVLSSDADASSPLSEEKATTFTRPYGFQSSEPGFLSLSPRA